jgi:hypothetical protein
VKRNAEEGATWVHSYVSADKRTTFCVYDAPTPIRPPGASCSAPGLVALWSIPVGVTMLRGGSTQRTRQGDAAALAAAYGRFSDRNASCCTEIGASGHAERLELELPTVT